MALLYWGSLNPKKVDRGRDRIYPCGGINQSVQSLLHRENNLDFKSSQSNEENAMVGNYSHLWCWSPNKCLGQDGDPRAELHWLCWHAQGSGIQAVPSSLVSRESFEISPSAESSSSSTPCPVSPCPWHHPSQGQGGENCIQPIPAHFHPHSGGPYARSCCHEAEDKLPGCFL